MGPLNDNRAVIATWLKSPSDNVHTYKKWSQEMHLPLRTILLFPMTTGARRTPPEKTTCLLRCFQLSYPITGCNYPRRDKDIFHSTVNLYIVPDNLISAHSSRNRKFSHLTCVFSISNAPWLTSAPTDKVPVLPPWASSGRFGFQPAPLRF